MKTVSAREGNQSFSKLLAEAAAGEVVEITRRGKAVARLVPVAGPDQTKAREAAVRRLLARLEEGVSLGGIRTSRDEAHER